MPDLRFTVVGTPAPQGSKRHVGNGVMVESSKRVKPWRQDVRAAAIEAREWMSHSTCDGPVRLYVAFAFARPKGHYRTGRNSHLLRDGAPIVVATRPDLDKCLRSTLDALGEAGVWRDDAQVAAIETVKGYCAEGQLPGAAIHVYDLTEEAAQ